MRTALPPIRLFPLLFGLPCLALAQEAPDSVMSTAGELQVETLASLEFPWGMEYLPDGRLLITEKPGRLRIWEDGELSEPVEGVPEVSYLGSEDQGGLLDVAVDPDFSDNGYIYLSYSVAEEASTELLETGDARFGPFMGAGTPAVLRGGVVARARLEEGGLQDLEVIWRQTPMTLGRGHFGHRLLFGDDGMLYLTSGDRMRFEPAQTPRTNLGKVLRLNPDGSLPDDNPFDDEEGALGDAWSQGHRNALAAAFHPETQDLWILEMGPLGGDELNRIEKGADYGWPAVSNGAHYGGQTIPGHPADMEFQDPVRTWTPVISPSGATFYQGERFSGWEGSLLVGGLSSQALVRLQLDGERVAVEERVDMQRRIRDVIEDPEGGLMLLVDAEEGALLRLTPAE